MCGRVRKISTREGLLSAQPREEYNTAHEEGTRTPALVSAAACGCGGGGTRTPGRPRQWTRRVLPPLSHDGLLPVLLTVQGSDTR